MPGIRIPESVSNIPLKTKASIRRGFLRFRELTPLQRTYAYEFAPRLLHSPNQLDPSVIAEQMGLPEEDAGDLMAALSFAAVLVATSPESVEHLAQVAVEARVLDADNKKPGSELIEGLLGERKQLENAVKVAQLAGEVLPSLVGVHSVVDLRASFAGEDIAYTVPAILMTLRVDSGPTREFTFQLTQDEAISMRDQLNKELHRAELLSQWAEKKVNDRLERPVVRG